MNHLSAIILAAGESGRMGTLKPLLPLGSGSVLEWVVDLFHNAGISDIRVVIGHRGEDIRDRLPSRRITWIQNENYRQGMLSSIKKGLMDLAMDRIGFFILPVDIPLVRPRTIAALLKKWSAVKNRTSILYPTFLDKRGHPPLISTGLIPKILGWEGQGGLKTFLQSRETEAQDLPVIDEYILKDMDTRPDYENIVTALDRYDIPTTAECTAILGNPALFSAATAAHCRAVSRLAFFLGSRIAPRNREIDLPRISAAAMLHDVAKGSPDHAHEGAALLTELGFPGIADIVANHMDIDFKENAPLTSREIVYLADKLVQGDRLVPLSVRFDNKLSRYGADPAAKSAILKRREDTLKIVRCLEKESGTALQNLLDEYAGETP